MVVEVFLSRIEIQAVPLARLLHIPGRQLIHPIDERNLPNRHQRADFPGDVYAVICRVKVVSEIVERMI